MPASSEESDELPVHNSFYEISNNEIILITN